MKSQKKNTVFYSLNEQDIQHVAKRVVKRKLDDMEIESVKRVISSNISWYEITKDAIHEIIRAKEEFNPIVTT